MSSFPFLSSDRNKTPIHRPINLVLRLADRFFFFFLKLKGNGLKEWIYIYIYIFPNPAYLINESSLNIKCSYNIAYLH